MKWRNNKYALITVYCPLPKNKPTTMPLQYLHFLDHTIVWKMCQQENHDYVKHKKINFNTIPNNVKWTNGLCFSNHDGTSRQCDNILHLINCCVDIKDLGTKWRCPHLCILPRPWTFNPSSLKHLIFQNIINHINVNKINDPPSPFSRLIFDLPKILQKQLFTFGCRNPEMRRIFLHEFPSSRVYDECLF